MTKYNIIGIINAALTARVEDKEEFV